MSPIPSQNIYAGMGRCLRSKLITQIITQSGGGFTWYDNLDGFDTTIDPVGFQRNIGYQFDADGDDGWGNLM